MKKHCNHCKITKDAREFHRDSKNKDGLSARCALCRNAAKRKKVAKEYTIPITRESDENILNVLLNKIGSYYVITVSKNRLCTLKKCGNPEQKWTARTPDDLLNVVMKSFDIPQKK